MNILGLGGSSHDFAACLLVDGKIKFAIEDERLSRVKHSDGLSNKTLMSCLAGIYCIEAEGLQLADMDLIIGNDIVDSRYYTPFHKMKEKVISINHHLAHAASTFYPSSFEEAAILVMDWGGSVIDSVNSLKETTTYYYGKGTELIEVKKTVGKMVEQNRFIEIESSIGSFYTGITQAIGFKKYNEGKTMGLAPYGSERFVSDFNRFYSMDEEGGFVQTVEHIRLLNIFLARQLIEKNVDRLDQIKADIAYALQYHVERIVIKACHYLYRKTNSKNLCLAGGVALNSVVNYKILEETPFENVFIQPAAGDGGTAIGSALYGYFSLAKQPRNDTKTIFNPYLGKEYEMAYIEQVLNQFENELTVEKADNVFKSAAQFISEGKIIGWYQGRSEIGPRSLGNRSILADARNPGMKDAINSRIKHREAFRPFAPIILEEKQEQYFSMAHPSYYMLFVPYILEEKRKNVPSITHVDGTGRVQTVNKQLNPVLHSLVTAFDELTGVPVLLNTSFNDNGEPIVETPLDAIQCFLKIDLDCLIIDNYIISKKS